MPWMPIYGFCSNMDLKGSKIFLRSEQQQLNNWMHHVYQINSTSLNSEEK